MQCVDRNLLSKAKISSTAHVQLLQWLHGKQQHHLILPAIRRKFCRIQLGRGITHAAYSIHVLNTI